MKKMFLFLLMAVSFLSAQDNWNGYGDTAGIKNFYADTTIYSGWFTLAQFSRIRHVLYLNDTAVAGFGSDSINAEWGIQTGSPSFLTTNIYKRKMALGKKIVLDTFSRFKASAFNLDSAGRTIIGTDAFPIFAKGKIDTLIDSMGRAVRSPYAYQSVFPVQAYDVFYRYWIHGLTGNKTVKNLKGYFQSSRETGIKVKPND